MTTTSLRRPRRNPDRRPLTRAVRALSLAAAVVAAMLVTAGPASADVPEGWDTPPDVPVMRTLLVLGGIPILLAVVIVVATLLPGMIKAQRRGGATDGASTGDLPELESWFGAPGEVPAQLPAAGQGDAPAGGASARW